MNNSKRLSIVSAIGLTAFIASVANFPTTKVKPYSIEKKENGTYLKVNIDKGSKYYAINDNVVSNERYIRLMQLLPGSPTRIGVGQKRTDESGLPSRLICTFNDTNYSVHIGATQYNPYNNLMSGEFLREIRTNLPNGDHLEYKLLLIQCPDCIYNED